VVDSITLGDGRRVNASLVDAANPGIFVQARDLGLSGSELPADCERDSKILTLMEEVRVEGALMMGLIDDPTKVSPAVPKIAIVAPPRDYKTITSEVIRSQDYDLLARTMALSVMHKAYAVTGGICLSAAALIEGTVVHQVTRPGAAAESMVRIGHPSGVSHYVVSVRKRAEDFELTKAAVVGTARRIMDGRVYVPRRLINVQ
jgi:hypothetical protein